jgi:ribulose-phosphate 3-epimerase
MKERDTFIAPSILSADFTRLGDELRAVEEAGADMIHVDVMDGHFVPNLTMGPFVVEAVKRATSLPIDAHLMVSDPERLVDAFIDAGADYVVFHTEACDDCDALTEHIHSRGAKAGVAVNPPNNFEMIEPYLPRVDMALIMTVNPGYAGQRFMADVLPKLEQIAEFKVQHGLGFLIEVDGGIGPGNVASVLENGGEVIVAASAVFGSGDARAGVRALREAMDRALASG